MKTTFSWLSVFIAFCFCCLSFMSCGYSTKSPGDINISLKLPNNFVLRDADATADLVMEMAGITGEMYDVFKEQAGFRVRAYAYKKDYASNVLLMQYDLKKVAVLLEGNISNVNDFYKLTQGGVASKTQSLHGTDVISEQTGYRQLSHYAVKGKYCYQVIITIPNRDDFKTFGIGKNPEDKISETLKFGAHGIIDGAIDGLFVIIKAPAHLFFNDIRIFATSNNGFSYILGVIIGILCLLGVAISVLNEL